MDNTTEYRVAREGYKIGESIHLGPEDKLVNFDYTDHKCIELVILRFVKGPEAP